MTPAALVLQPGVSTCPSCGRPLRRPRHTPVPAEASIDTRGMSDTELYRHFKRTAPVEDLRFFLRVASVSPEVRAAGEALLAAGCHDTGGTLSRADWYRRLTTLQDRWRQEPAGTLRQDVPALMAEAV
jgi:hypothetical protein